MRIHLVKCVQGMESVNLREAHVCFFQCVFTLDVFFKRFKLYKILQALFFLYHNIDDICEYLQTFMHFTSSMFRLLFDIF